MKLSFALSYQDTAFSSIGKGPIIDLLECMADVGYDGVEFGIRDPAMVDARAVSTVLQKMGLGLVAIGTGQAFVDDRLSMTLDEAAVRQATIERLKKQVDLAKIFSAKVILGLIRGNLGDDKSRRFKYFETGLCELCDYAHPKGVTLLIEPLNRYESDFLHCGDEVLALIRKLSFEGLRILLDSFHMNIEEKDPAQTISSVGDYLAHVHLADSNRQYPGQGHIDFRKLIAALGEIGYSAYLSGEMLNDPDVKTCMVKYHDYLKGIVNE